MAGLRIERPCRVRKAGEGRWEWTCLCSPAVWPCTGREATWVAAQDAADHHVTTSHAAPVPPVMLAPVLDLTAYRAAKVAKAANGARVLEFPPPTVRPGGGAA